MHHPIDRIADTTALLSQLWRSGWVEMTEAAEFVSRIILVCTIGFFFFHFVTYSFRTIMLSSFRTIFISYNTRFVP